MEKKELYIYTFHNEKIKIIIKLYITKNMEVYKFKKILICK